MWLARKAGRVKEEWEEQVLKRVGGVRINFDMCETGRAHGEGAGEILLKVRFNFPWERKLIGDFFGGEGGWPVLRPLST